MAEDQTQPAPKAKRKPKPKKLSREQKWIGYVILGFGLMISLSIINIVLSQIKPANQQVQKQDPELTALRSSLENLPGSEKPQRKTSFLGNTKTQKDKRIREKDITGTWQTELAYSKAILQLNDGVYRIIIAFHSKGLPRRYSNGTYTLDKGVLLLKPRLDWGAPQKLQGERTSYQSLTTAEFPVLVIKKQEKLIWQSPPEYETSARVHPFLRLGTNGTAVWGSLE